MNLPTLLSLRDLQIRWDMSRQAVHNRRKRDSDFPEKLMTVSDGTVPLFSEEEVVKYEKKHPEVSSPSLRDARRKWIFKTYIADKTT